MNSVKITYIITATILELVFILGAIIIPIYVTLGYYWWSSILLLLAIATSAGFTKRVNSWGNFGNV